MKKTETRVFETSEASGEDLRELIRYRRDGKFDFKLIDIREVYEYLDRSIDGTDLLYPTTLLHAYIDDLEEMKEECMILYCHTGNRTGELLKILKSMGFKRIAHLSRGIAKYSGQTSQNAKLPNNIKEKI